MGVRVSLEHYRRVERSDCLRFDMVQSKDVARYGSKDTYLPYRGSRRRGTGNRRAYVQYLLK